MQAEKLGSQSFKKAYGLRYAYLGGAMYRGIASAEIVIQLAKHGYMGYLGSGGLSSEQLESAIQTIKAELGDRYPYGANFLCQPERPEEEEALVDRLLHHKVRNIEAAAFVHMTPALVRFRCLGLYKNSAGQVCTRHRVLAKVSRPEVTRTFLSSAPQNIVDRLCQENKITSEQALLSQQISMADDICCEADSGGHTDQAVMAVLLPSICRIKDEVCSELHWSYPIHVGIAGGIGTPEAVAAAFVLGADFVVVGSIHQCAVEAGTSDLAKSLLSKAKIHETAIAPAGDMFELGAKVQVLSHGTLFHARANKLYDLYRFYNRLEEIPASVRKIIEEKYFSKSIDSVWEETKRFFEKANPAQIMKAEQSSKHKMALVFRWYFYHSTEVAMQGDPKYQANFQIQCGPAMGAFNEYVKGSELSFWQNRHVHQIANQLMQDAAQYLSSYFRISTLEIA